MKSNIHFFYGLLITLIICSISIADVDAQRPPRSEPARSGGSSPVRIAPSYRPSRILPPARRYYRSPVLLYNRRFTGLYSPFQRYYTPWLGLRFGVLPWGYFSFNFGPDLFYYYDGIFYRRFDDYYEVVAPPVGAEVPSLPAGAKEVRINGELYFEKNGVYYQQKGGGDQKKAFVVAGKDGALETPNSPDPREGDIVHQLPDNSRKVVINGLEYYVAPNGFYYQETVDGDKTAYKVVGSAADADEH